MNEVTIPKLPPPPRIAQNRSALAVGVHVDDRAVGEHDLGREQVVDRETATARQMPDPAAERQAAHAGRRDDAAGHRQAVLVCRPVDCRRAEPRRPRPPSGSPDRPSTLDIGARSRTRPSSTVPSPAPLCPARAHREGEALARARTRCPRSRPPRRRTGRSPRAACRSSRCRPPGPRRSGRRRGRSPHPAGASSAPPVPRQQLLPCHPSSCLEAAPTLRRGGAPTKSPAGRRCGGAGRCDGRGPAAGAAIRPWARASRGPRP